MEDEERPADQAILAALTDLGRKLDTVAGAVASIAGRHHDLLDHAAEGEARRGQDSLALSHRLEALERQILNLGLAGPAAAPVEVDLSAVEARLDELAAAAVRQRDGLALSFEVLSRLADAVDALATPSPELPVVAPDPEPDRSAEVVRAVQSLSDQLPELSDDVTQRLSDHTDAALAGVLRLLDVRLAMLRQALTEGDPLVGGSSRGSGFEAGAVMGAAQAAWTHLEQRLETEFDDLGRQLQAMAAVIETVAGTTEDLASRPVTSDQIRKAAAVARDAVVSANRTRRERRGGPKSLGS